MKQEWNECALLAAWDWWDYHEAKRTGGSAPRIAALRGEATRQSDEARAQFTCIAGGKHD